MVEISVGGEKILFCEIYRPPSGDFDVFLTTLCELMAVAPRRLVIGMDHNVNLLTYKTDNKANDLLSSVLCEGFTPHITKATRITATSRTLIDGLFSRGVNIVDNKVITCDVSDHFGCFVALSMDSGITKANEIYYSAVQHYGPRDSME